MRLSIVLLVALFHLVSAYAEAAEMRWSDDGFGGLNLVLSGPLMPGDYEDLHSMIKRSPVDFLRSDMILLSSKGGSVDEAMSIAELVRNTSLIAAVDEHGECSSACFLILAGSNIRVLGGPVRIHRPYMPEASYSEQPTAEAQAKHEAGMHRIRDYLVSRMVPSHIIDKMMSRASNESYTLSVYDVTTLGIMSPSFEEAAIAKCGYSTRKFLEASATQQETICLKEMQQLARIIYLRGLIGEELLRAAMRDFLLSMGGQELEDGRIVMPAR